MEKGDRYGVLYPDGRREGFPPVWSSNSWKS